MSIPRNLGNFADNVNTNGKVEVTGINATGTPSGSTALLGDGTWGTVTTSPAGSNTQIQYNNAGAFGAISSGTSGQVLTSAGSGSAPTWSTPSAGAMVFISSQTISSPVASIDFTSGFSSTYDDYLVIYDNLTVSAQDNLYLRIYKDGSLVTASYTMEILRGASTTAAAATDLNRVEITLGGTIRTTTIQSLGTIRVFNANNTNVGLLFNTSCLDNSSTNNNFVNVGGVTNTATGITSGLKFYLAAGNNIATGTFKLYGIAKS